MSLTVTINGTNRSASIPWASPAWSSTVSQRDTFSFQALTDGSWAPEVGQAVVLSHSGYADPLFGGTIDRLARTLLPGGGSKWDISCVSYEQLLDRRQTGVRTYSDTPAGDVAAAIITDCLTGDGLGSVTVAGPTIASLALEYAACSDGVNKICEQASDDTDTYVWDVTPGKVFRFYKQDTYPAPFAITSNNGLWEALTISRTREKYANRVYLRGRYILDPQTETFHGDGSAQTFEVGYPLAATPTIKLNDVEQSVGVGGVDSGKQWYWNLDSNRIEQDAGGTPLVLADNLEITYQGYDARAVLYQNDDAVTERQGVEGGTGYYETVMEASRPGTGAELLAMAEAIALKAGNIPVIVDVLTDAPGLRSGQALDIDIPEAGIDDTFLIQSVSLFAVAAGRYRFRVRAVKGALIPTWQKALAALAGARGGVSAIGAPTGAGGAAADAITEITDQDITLTGGAQLVIVHAVTQACTVTLQDASTMIGKQVTIKRADDSTCDVNYQPASGQQIDGSGAASALTQSGESVGIKGVDATNWTVVSHAGDVTSPPAPDAPNVTAATATAYYCDDPGGAESSTGTLYGLKGTITLPTGDGNYAHLKRLEVVATPPDGVERVVYATTAPWSGSTINWKSDAWERPGSNQTFPTVKFRAINEDNHVTDDPYTVSNVSVTGQSRPPALPSSVTLADSGSRVREADTNISTLLTVTPSPLSPSRAEWFVVEATNYTEPTKWDWIGKFPVGAAFSFRRLVFPASGASWKVRVSTGCIYGENPQASGVQSNTLAVAGVADPAATWITDAAISAASYATDADGHSLVHATITFTTPTTAAAPEFWTAKLERRRVDSAGNPTSDADGTWAEMASSAEPGQGFSYTIPGWPVYPDAQQYREYQFRVRCLNRAETAVVQNAWSGAASGRLVPAVQAGVIPATRIAASTWGAGIVQGTDDRPTLDVGNSANLLSNGGFEQDPAKADTGLLCPYWYGEQAAIVGGAYTGARCIKLSPVEGAAARIVYMIPGQPWYGQAVIAVRPGDKILAEAWAKAADGATAYLQFDVNYFDAAGVLLGSFQAWAPPEATDWTRVCKEVTVPTGASYLGVSLAPTNYGPGHWYVDNVVLRLLPIAGQGIETDGSGGTRIALPAGSEFGFDQDDKLIQVGVDFSKAKAGTYSDEFEIAAGKYQMSLVDLAKAAGFDTSQFSNTGGSFTAHAFAADIIKSGILEVGGAASGGTRASRLKVFDTASPTPNLIGFIGDDSAGSGYVGAWFKRARIGGSSVSDTTHQIVADANGDLVIPGALVFGAVANATSAATAISANSATTATSATSSDSASTVPAGGVQGGLEAGGASLPLTYIAARDGSDALFFWAGKVSGAYGIWARNGGFGGSGPADAKIKLLADGSVTIDGAPFTLAVNGITAKIDNSLVGGLYYAGFQVYNDTYPNLKSYLSAGLVACVASNGVGAAGMHALGGYGYFYLLSETNQTLITASAHDGNPFFSVSGIIQAQQHYTWQQGWNLVPLSLGGYSLWIDGGGRLRIKSGAPSSDTDGTVVGTQS